MVIALLEYIVVQLQRDIIELKQHNLNLWNKLYSRREKHIPANYNNGVSMPTQRRRDCK